MNSTKIRGSGLFFVVVFVLKRSPSEQAVEAIRVSVGCSLGEPCLCPREPHRSYPGKPKVLQTCSPYR